MAGSGECGLQECLRRARATKEKSCFVAGEANPYGWAALRPPKDFVVPPEQPSIETSYSWVRLVVSITLSTLGCVGLWSLAVALPAVQADFGVQRAGASLPYTLTMIGFMSGGIMAGRLADRFGILPPLAGCTILMGFGYVLTASAPTLPVFAGVSGLTIGLGSAASFAPLVADASLWFDRHCGLAITIGSSVGQADVAIELFEKSLRLNPLRKAPATFSIGIAHFFTRRLEKAAATLLVSLQETPNWAPCLRFLASCYAHLGRLVDAGSIVEKLRQITPVLVPSAEDWRVREDREFYLDGLRLAVDQTARPVNATQGDN